MKGCCDNLDHGRAVKVVAHHLHPDQRWILLHLQRWLNVLLQQEAGARSPLLVNPFMHLRVRRLDGAGGPDRVPFGNSVTGTDALYRVGLLRASAAVSTTSLPGSVRGLLAYAWTAGAG